MVLHTKDVFQTIFRCQIIKIIYSLFPSLLVWPSLIGFRIGAQLRLMKKGRTQMAWIGDIVALAVLPKMMPG